MRTFLMTLLISTIATAVLWNLGLAHKIWPAHPFAATCIFAALAATLVQMLLTYNPYASPKRR